MLLNSPNVRNPLKTTLPLVKQFGQVGFTTKAQVLAVKEAIVVANL
jgi:hypothetical protein